MAGSARARRTSRRARERRRDRSESLIADDQALVRAGFRLILERRARHRGGRRGRRRRRGGRAGPRLTGPTSSLMDIRMPRHGRHRGDRAVLATARHGAPRVSMLTTFDLDEYVYEALRAGASGFLLKDVPRRAARRRRSAWWRAGDALLAPSVTRRLIEQFARHASAGREPPAELADADRPRELEVLRAGRARAVQRRDRRRGSSSSETTVKTHVARMLTKLDLRDRVAGRRPRLRDGARHAGRCGVAGSRRRRDLSCPGVSRRGATLSLASSSRSVAGRSSPNFAGARGPAAALAQRLDVDRQELRRAASALMSSPSSERRPAAGMMPTGVSIGLGRRPRSGGRSTRARGVLAEPGHRKLPVAVLAEPVDVEDPRQVRALALPIFSQWPK